MADQKLSARSATATITGGYIPIIIPDGGEPSGYASYRISVTNLLASVQSQITTNAGDITTLDGRVTVVEEINKRETFSNKTTAFTFSQPANSTITKIVARGANNGETLQIGTTLAGDELADMTFQTAYDLRATKVKDYDTRTLRTIYLTPTGTIDVDIYYTQNTV